MRNFDLSPLMRQWIGFDKLANALQNAALQSLQESGVLDTLPKELQQVAQARLANPEATLRELSGLLPGLSRSTVDRRLRRLVELAQARMEETQ